MIGNGYFAPHPVCAPFYIGTIQIPPVQHEEHALVRGEERHRVLVAGDVDGMDADVEDQVAFECLIDADRLAAEAVDAQQRGDVFDGLRTPALSHRGGHAVSVGSL